MVEVNLKNHLLIAMPGLADPNFHHSVALICEHNNEGAIGIILNRPLDLKLREVLNHLEVAEKTGACSCADQPVLLGGPVQVEHGFILHQPKGEWSATLSIDAKTGLTSSIDILQAIAAGKGPERILIALGYAGWGAGQLEKELAENSWLCVPTDPDIMFDLPHEQRWHAAAGKLGIDLNLLPADAGHA